MRSFALVLLLCTGCDLLFDIHKIELASDAAGSDTHGSDASVGPPACSPITMLADDFATDDLATMWPATSALSSNQILVTAGQLLMVNLAADSYATLDPGRYFDLREHYFSVRITDDMMMDAKDFVSLGLDSEVSGFSATFSRNNTTMTFVEFTPQMSIPVASFPYEAFDQQYLRVGVIGGALVFETSPNGVTWTRQASVTDGSGFTYVHPSIQTHRGISSPQFTAYVDDVDNGTPSGAACAIEHLHDDFSGTMLGEQWARSEMYGGTVTPVGGIADVRTTGEASLVTLGASTIYDLENGAVSIEIPQMIVAAQANTVKLSVTTGTGDTTTIQQSNGLFQASSTSSAAPIIQQSYDPVGMRWWRIANQPAGMTWDVSSDGVAWTRLNAPFALAGIDRCDIAIVVESESGTGGDTQIDNVDVHP